MKAVLRHIKELSLVAVIGLVAIFILFLYPKWREVTSHGGQSYAEPFRIAGNFYYVGAADTTSFLLTGPEGHVLIDGGYPGNPPMIVASIKQLGFDIKDVRVLLNTEPFLDHAGGLADLQKASGARLAISEQDAGVVSAGGAGARLGLQKPFSYLPFFQYPAPRVDHRFKDGETIRLGPIELTAHVTPGCTAWSFAVRHGSRDLHVVHLCGATPPATIGVIDRALFSKARPDFERSLRTLRSLPVDIWVTTHARAWGRYRKFEQSRGAADPVAPFLDREGYFRALDRMEGEFRALMGEEEGAARGQRQ